MSRETLLKAVNEVFWDVFDDESLDIREETTAADVNGWDSLRHITLIENIEDRFDIRFTMLEVNGMKNVGEMLDIIAERARE
ncbi:acyl carrier protein [Clostridiaceae bacterium]|nr:acyl carrier protein [Clostridiaceae bacterium]RKI16471.1 acyl carrier protein [bacterium 1XD21-70]